MRRSAGRTAHSWARCSRRSRTVSKALCARSRWRLSAYSRHLRYSGRPEHLSTDRDQQQAPPPNALPIFSIVCHWSRVLAPKGKEKRGTFQPPIPILYASWCIIYDANIVTHCLFENWKDGVLLSADD